MEKYKAKKRNVIVLLFAILLCSSITLAINEELIITCGGNSELKILCSGDIEKLYEIPEPINVTIDFPTTSDVNINEIDMLISMEKNLALCEYSLDALENVSMGAAASNWNIPLTIDDGYHQIDVWCNDTFNLNSYHTSVNFYVYAGTSVIVPGGGGGETGGTPINLYRMEIAGLDWGFGVDNVVNVRTYDIIGNLTDPDSMSMEVLSDVEITSELVTRLEDGIYRGVFNIEDSNLTEIIINITAREQGKVLNELFSIPTVKATDFEKFQMYTKNQLKVADSFWYSIRWYIYVFSIMMLVGCIWLFVVIGIRRRRRREE